MFSEKEYLNEEIDCSRLLGITLDDYRKFVEINNSNYIFEEEEKYVSNHKRNVKIGDIWICNIPIIAYGNNNEIKVHLQKRPVLIIDNGSGKIVKKDKRNYHILKFTTQEDKYMRKYIDNWDNLGLNYKSYIRIELPIKIEKQQLENKIAKLNKEQLNSIYKDIYSIINISNLND